MVSNLVAFRYSFMMDYGAMNLVTTFFSRVGKCSVNSSLIVMPLAWYFSSKVSSL